MKTQQKPHADKFTSLEGAILLFILIVIYCSIH